MTLLTVFVGIIAFSNLILLLAVAFLAFSLKRVLDKSVMPAVSEVKATIANVHEMVDRIESRAERIMEISEDTARKVSGTVVATTEVVTESVAEPLINVSSLLAGISRAIQTWRQASTRT